MPRICDYEGSQYRTDFWGSQNREYEDRVERIAMAKLLPPRGELLIEIGAGFGRLADLYCGYRHVVLMDYARSQLEEAQRYLGQHDRFIYVVADVYNLPFVDSLFDTLTMVRVMHHLADVPAALAELYRILAPRGTIVTEYASKFHLKSLVRWLLRRQDWNPFAQAPYEFVELNFNFHPAWMRQQFTTAGLRIKNTRTLSHYRINLLKTLLPTSLLVWLDSWAQPTGNWWQLTPSLFVQAEAQKSSGRSVSSFFRCPACGSVALPDPRMLLETNQPPSAEPDSQAVLQCGGCQRRWSFSAGIYDFKTPLPD